MKRSLIMWAVVSLTAGLLSCQGNLTDSQLAGGPTGNQVIELTDANYEDKMLSRKDGSILAVQFYKPDCSHCEQQHSEFKKAAARPEHGRDFHLFRLNLSDEQGNSQTTKLRDHYSKQKNADHLHIVFYQYDTKTKNWKAEVENISKAVLSADKLLERVGLVEFNAKGIERLTDANFKEYLYGDKPTVVYFHKSATQVKIAQHQVEAESLSSLPSIDSSESQPVAFALGCPGGSCYPSYSYGSSCPGGSCGPSYGGSYDGGKRPSAKAKSAAPVAKKMVSPIRPVASKNASTHAVMNELASKKADGYRVVYLDLSKNDSDTAKLRTYYGKQGRLKSFPFAAVYALKHDYARGYYDEKITVTGMQELINGAQKAFGKKPLAENSAGSRKQLLVFSASWCGPCRQYAGSTLNTPQFKSAQESQGWSYKKIDPATDMERFKKLGGSGIPFTVWMVDGQVVKKETGPVGLGAMLKSLQEID